MKKHICIVCNEYPPCKHGGIGSFSKDLAQGLLSKGHKVSVIGIYHKRELEVKEAYVEEVEGVWVYRLPLLKIFHYHRLDLVYNRIRLYFAIKKLHKEESIDMLEAPDFDGWMPFGTPKNIPFVTRLHGGVTFYAKILERKMSPITKFLERRQLKQSAKIVSVSEHTAKTTCEILKLPQLYQVIYNSIKMPEQLPEEKLEEGLILFYGSVIPKKGVKELVLAFELIAENLPKAKLVIAGKNNHMHEGRPYEKYLLELVSETIRNRILFTGPLDREKELFPLVMRAHLCCFPSHAEAFALAPLEAMAMGKAVLFTIYTSGPEAIEDGISGVLADTKNPEHIAEKIELVLKNESLAKRMGINAQKRIENRFSYKAWIEDNNIMFESLSKGVE